jgi:hypothetical protein
MKILLYIIILISLINSCSSVNEDKSIIPPPIINIEEVKADTNIVVSNPLLYDENWLIEFKLIHSSCNSLKLLNDTLYLECSNPSDSYTGTVPSDLPLNMEVEYNSIGNDTLYNLLLTRINLSSVQYDYSVSYKNKTLQELKGLAHINTKFYKEHSAIVGLDGWPDLVVEYIDKTNTKCSFHIISTQEIETAYTHFSWECENEITLFKSDLLIKTK